VLSRIAQTTYSLPALWGRRLEDKAQRFFHRLARYYTDPSPFISGEQKPLSYLALGQSTSSGKPFAGHYSEKNQCGLTTHIRHPLQLIETFIERDCFRGTCYWADNWKLFGQTTERSCQDRYASMSVPVKTSTLIS